MLIVVYGTTGELIKILPLIKSVPKEQLITICTYQQPQQLRQLVEEADIPKPTFAVGRRPDQSDLESMWQIPGWAIRVHVGLLMKRRKIRQLAGSRKNTIVLVHGDTLTTVFGALWGRLLGYKVGHIEAGLRSHNWRHPFPEELDRLTVSKLARVHFSPGKTPERNLAKVKGEIIQTDYNTVLDSLRLAKNDKSKNDFKLPDKYAVISIHRNELLAEKPVLEHFLKTVRMQAKKDNLIFLDHPVTKQRLGELGYDHFLDHPKITRLPKLSYYKFIKLVTNAQYVLTDSGGLQEETAYLGIPCLVHRVATEREEGLGQNVVLSEYKAEKLADFLKDPSRYHRGGLAETVSPTEKIITYLKNQKYL